MTPYSLQTKNQTRNMEFQALLHQNQTSDFLQLCLYFLLESSAFSKLYSREQ